MLNGKFKYMDKEVIAPSTGKEMNFFDLCVACGHAIGNACKWFVQVLAEMCRLTYRSWWLVGLVVIMAIAASLYYTRQDNLKFRFNAVLRLNGPSIQQFEQAYIPLKSGLTLPEDAAITPFVKKREVTEIMTFRVVDCLDDGVADYIDFSGKSSPIDTVKVQMQDRICLQFRVKQRNFEYLPEIENAILAYLNANDALQSAYRTYLPNLRSEAEFNHRQALKLDSLTSNYYFYHPSSAQPMNYNGNGVNFYGDRRVRLFLDEIYDQREHMEMLDQRLQLATAPVTLENHFSIDPKPVNGRIKYLIIFLLLGWIAGCALAAGVEQRKTIVEWLNK